MKVLGESIQDKRINSHNYMLEMTLKEYYDLSNGILKNNEYQRRRVKSSSTVYSLLKEDLKRGCLMPPIVLALSKSSNDVKTDDVVDTIKQHQSEIVILDGLQRSYTIKGLIEEMEKTGDDDMQRVFSNKIRAEIYIGINKLGILYRMLTLNTGQTQMSTRHQIEIIYSDYVNTDVEGIRLLREIDDQSARRLGEYKFQDVIEGFTSFVQRDYLTMERVDILENIKSLEKLSNIDPSNCLFELFLRTYNNMVRTLYEIEPGKLLTQDEQEELSSVFGPDVITIFKKSQPMTGFGAAIGKLIDFEIINTLEDVIQLTERINANSVKEGLKLLLKNLSRVRDVAKKIGNDQRLYFYQVFRNLFDKESEGYCDLFSAAQKGYRDYQRETM